MTTLTIKSAKSIITRGGRSFIGLPIKGDRAHLLRDAFADLISSWAGEGALIRDEDGVRTYLVLIDQRDTRHHEELPPGEWVVRYDLDDINGSNVTGVFAACEVASFNRR